MSLRRSHGLRERARVFPAGLFMLLLISSCAVSGNYVVDYGSLVASSRLLVPKSKKAPTWSMNLESRGVDDVVFLENHRVLVGHLDLEPMGNGVSQITARGMGLYRPVCDSFVAYDESSGQPVWKFDRKRVPVGQSSILKSSPLVWIRSVLGDKKAQVVVLNPDTGKTIAQIDDSEGGTWIVPSDGSGLVELGVGGNKLRRRSFSNSDGTLAHEASVSLGDPALDGARLLDATEIEGGFAGLVSNGKGDLVRLAVFDNAQERVATADVAVSKATAALRTGPKGLMSVLGLRTAPAQSSATIVDRTGAVVTTLSEDFDDARFLGDNLVVWRRDGVVRSYAVASGKMQWTSSLGEKVVGAPTSWQHAIVVTGTKGLHCLDSDNGQERCSVALPSHFLASRLPEHLMTDGNDLVVVGETGFLRVSGTSPPGVTRSAEWRGARGASYGAYRLAYRSIEEFVGRVKNVNVESAAETARALDLSAKMIIDTNTRFNEQQRGLVKAGVIPDTRGSARARYDSAMAAASTATILEGYAAGLELRAALFEGVDPFMTMMQHAQALVTVLTTAHVNNSMHPLRGKWSVRPLLWQAGQGAVVTNLETGNWVELATGPPEHLTDEYFFPVSIPFLSPDGHALVVEGVDGDPKRWRTDDRVHPLMVPKRSLMFFELGDSDYEAAEAYAKKSIVPDREEVDSVGNYANPVVFH